MNVRCEDVKGGWRRVVRRWVSAGSSVDWGKLLLDTAEVDVFVGSKSLSAGRSGVNWRMG